jgi:hypothetical protein
LSEHIYQALDLIEKSENDKLSKAQLFAHVAQVLADKGDHGQAKIAMKDSLRLLHEIDILKNIQNSLCC